MYHHHQKRKYFIEYLNLTIDFGSISLCFNTKHFFKSKFIRSIDEEDDDDHVEDLSMSRKKSIEKLSPPPSPVTVAVPNPDAVPPASGQQLGVIVPARALSPTQN